MGTTSCTNYYKAEMPNTIPVWKVHFYHILTLGLMSSGYVHTLILTPSNMIYPSSIPLTPTSPPNVRLVNWRNRRKIRQRDKCYRPRPQRDDARPREDGSLMLDSSGRKCGRAGDKDPHRPLVRHRSLRPDKPAGHPMSSPPNPPGISHKTQPNKIQPRGTWVPP